jgi:hypothetical protein
MGPRYSISERVRMVTCSSYCPLVEVETVTPTASRWRLDAYPEASASQHASASSPRYRLAEHIGFAAVVMAELKLCQV